MARVPKRFVGLHAHDGFSTYDGMSLPQDHIDFCMENGLDAWAMTNHGHMNSYPHAQLYVEKLRKDGREFKLLPGVEAYLHPDLEEWKREYEADKERKKDEKKSKDAPVDTGSQLTIENEDETKGGKHFDPINRRHHLVVLPKTSRGLQRVIYLVSRGYLEGFYRFPRVDYEMLKEAAQDGEIIVSTACLGGPLAYEALKVAQDTPWNELCSHTYDELREHEHSDPVRAMMIPYDALVAAVGAENVYLELQFNRIPAQNYVNRCIIEFARFMNLEDRLIVTVDSHYPRPELWKEREIYKRLIWQDYTDFSPDMLPQSSDELQCELYPKNAEQVWRSYLEAKALDGDFYDDDVICDAIERTWHVAHEVIGEVEPDRSPKFPTERLIPKGTSSFKHLVVLCMDGMRRRGLSDRPEYVARLKHELGVIKVMKNADYFISYQKIMELARSAVLCGPGRGSGGGSLVAYVLYITDLDPIKWDLPFARFLSVHRKGAPDIDTDISDRDKVLDLLREFFGFENVVPISNYNTLQLKSLTKDLAKFYGVPFEEANAATRTVDQEVRKATMKHGDDKNLFVLKYEDALKHCESYRRFIEKYPQVAEAIQVLFKQNRSLGRHAGGVLIADDLPKKMPLILNKGEPQSPWVEGVNYKHLEYIGNFIKYDLLGLETLRLIERTIELILIEEGNKDPSFDDVKAWFDEHMSPDVIDFDDQSVYEYVYHSGRWAGIFQCTSQGAQRLFVKAQPRSIVDIATLTSIYRPGPLAADVDKLYIKAKHGTNYEWPDPRIGEILKNTYGCIIFQEQVMELAEKVAGFPKDECDQVRRAIMKRSISGGAEAKKKAKETRDGFVRGCVENGYTRAVANDLYDKILYFAGYGFNKAHATAYAIDSYFCAWLMTHHEPQWLCAYAESMSTNDVKRAKAWSELRALGYQIVPIDIRDASAYWRILPGKKMMPSLTSCKGVGLTAARELEELRMIPDDESMPSAAELAEDLDLHETMPDEQPMRPFEDFEELLWDADGGWRPSKFNKKAIEALVNVGAFASLGIIGEGKTFRNYHHMYRVVVEHMSEIKRTLKSDPLAGKKRYYELIRELADTPAWTRQERMQLTVKHFGSVDVNSLVPVPIAERLAKKGVESIDDFDETNIYWFCIADQKARTSKNGRKYLILNVLGPAGKRHKMFMWSWDGQLRFEPYTVVLGEVSSNEFGFTTSQRKLRVLDV